MEVKNETEREVSFTGFSTTACPRAEDACLRAQKLVDKEHVAQDVENFKSRWELMPSRQITTTFSLRRSFHCDGFKKKKKKTQCLLSYIILFIGVFFMLLRNKCAPMGSHVTVLPE